MTNKHHIRALVAAGYSDAEIADRFGVTSRTVRRWRSSARLASRWSATPPLHGTRARYVKGCRCKPCTAANTEYHALVRRVYARARREAPTSD